MRTRDKVQLVGVIQSAWWFLLFLFLLEDHLEFAAAGICSELISPLGYPCEEHQVTTTDGYILGVQRISTGIQGITSQHALPVFLQHGVLAVLLKILSMGGEHWVLNSPNESLAFILADSGFDVWIGSLRGTQWSQGHVSLTLNSSSYWNWTWDEHLNYDLPAMLKFVRDTTGSPVKYVGHSQGTIFFLAGLTQSSVTQYVDKAALLAPIAYLDHMTSIMGNALARLFLDQALLHVGIREFNTSSGVGKELIDLYCGLIPSDCSDLLTAFTGPNCCINSTRLPFYQQYEPQPTSTKNIAHLSQMVRTGHFRKYDYGLFGNLEHYGQPIPPAYSLSSIPASFPLMLAYGGIDALADVNDVKHLIDDLPNPYVLQYLPNYGHLDYTIGKSANRDVYQPMIQFLKGN